jgi:hypothetical protein
MSEERPESDGDRVSAQRLLLGKRRAGDNIVTGDAADSRGVRLKPEPPSRRLSRSCRMGAAAEID